MGESDVYYKGERMSTAKAMKIAGIKAHTFREKEIIGTWLAGRDRESVFVATKARFKTSDHANGVGLSRKHLYRAIRESLARLKTDYVDLQTPGIPGNLSAWKSYRSHYER